MAEIPADSQAAGHDDHPEFLEHHYKTPSQQQDAATLGMWVFLVTEVLFFSGLFCAYAYYRMLHPEIFMIGHKFLDVTLGAVNTVVLILSSFTVAMSVWFIQHNKRTACTICLALTLLGAFAFMGIKAVEYADKLQKGKTWGESFAAKEYYEKRGMIVDSHAGAADHSERAGDGAAADDQADHANAVVPNPDPVATGAVEAYEPSTVENAGITADGTVNVGLIDPEEADGAHIDGHDKHAFTTAELTRRDLHIFMGVYFCLTGLHGIHVLAGIGAITWVLVRNMKGHFSGEYHTPVHLVGLYWHLVDLVWIYLFPLLYLIH